MKTAWYQSSEKGLLPGVGAFRGLAAFLIFLFHYWTFFGGEGALFVAFKAGHLGLDIFFVLSGLLLFLSLARDGEVSKRFFVRRFWRLFPLAAVFTMAVFLFKGNGFWFSEEGIKNLFAHLFFAQSLFFDTYWGLNPVMWTLTLEMLFIFLLPLLLVLTRRRGVFVFTLLALIALSLAYRAWLWRFFSEWTPQERIFYSEQLWGRFDQFAFGALLGVFWVSNLRKKISNFFAIANLAMGFVGFLTCLVIFALLGGDFRESLILQTFLHSATALFFTLFLFGYLTNKNRGVRTFFAPAPFAWLGTVSYSFFLWHFPILSVLAKTGIAPVFAFFGALALTIILSVGSHFLLERRFTGEIKAKSKRVSDNRVA